MLKYYIYNNNRQNHWISHFFLKYFLCYNIGIQLFTIYEIIICFINFK